MSDLDLFKDIIPSILQTKKNVLINDKDYIPYVVNKALSFHYDCIFHANKMNQLPNTDRLLQYHYFMNSVRGYKRPHQYIKKEVIEDLKNIKEYYNCSNEKAKEILLLLTPKETGIIKNRVNRGGIKTKKT